MKEETDVTIIARRVSALERQNRFLRRAAVGVASVLVLLASMGQMRQGARPTRTTVEAENFVVRDQAGAVRASFGVHPNGGVGLVAMGLGRVYVGVNPEGGVGAALQDAEGKLRGSFALKQTGEASLELNGPQGATRLRLTVAPDGAPSVHLYDKMGKDRAALVMLPDQTAGLLIFDSEGKVRSALATQGDGTSGLDFLDAADKARLSLSVKPDGSPVLLLTGDHAQPLFRAPQK